MKIIEKIKEFFRIEDDYIRVVTPKWMLRKIRKNPYWCGSCIGYSKLKKMYSRYELIPRINGRRVKYWKQVNMADDSEGDDFIPIFYKNEH